MLDKYKLLNMSSSENKDIIIIIIILFFYCKLCYFALLIKKGYSLFFHVR